MDGGREGKGAQKVSTGVGRGTDERGKKTKWVAYVIDSGFRDG